MAAVVGAVLLGLTLRAAPNSTVTPEQAVSVMASYFPGEGLPQATETSFTGDIQLYLLDRPVDSRPIPGTPSERRLDSPTAAGVLGPPPATGFDDGYARAWIDDDEGDQVFAVVYRYATPGQAAASVDALTTSYEASLRSKPTALTDYDKGATLLGTKRGKNGFITTVGIGEVANLITVIVADQPDIARFGTIDSLLSQERGALS